MIGVIAGLVSYNEGGSCVAWFRNRQATIFTPSVAQRFRLLGSAFNPTMSCCISSIVAMVEVRADAICSALYSFSKDASSPKFVKNETYSAAMCSLSVPPLICT